jgi:hypothetical protein
MILKRLRSISVFIFVISNQFIDFFLMIKFTLTFASFSFLMLAFSATFFISGELVYRSLMFLLLFLTSARLRPLEMAKHQKGLSCQVHSSYPSFSYPEIHLSQRHESQRQLSQFILLSRIHLSQPHESQRQLSQFL